MADEDDPPTDEGRGVGQRIRTRRKGKGWSQEKLARRLDVSTSSVQNWERGHVTTIRGPNRQALATLLGGEPGDYLPAEPSLLEAITQEMADLKRRMDALELDRRPDVDSAQDTAADQNRSDRS